MIGGRDSSLTRKSSPPGRSRGLLGSIATCTLSSPGADHHEVLRSASLASLAFPIGVYVDGSARSDDLISASARSYTYSIGYMDRTERAPLSGPDRLAVSSCSAWCRARSEMLFIFWKILSCLLYALFTTMLTRDAGSGVPQFTILRSATSRFSPHSSRISCTGRWNFQTCRKSGRHADVLSPVPGIDIGGPTPHDAAVLVGMSSPRNFLCIFGSGLSLRPDTRDGLAARWHHQRGRLLG